MHPFSATDSLSSFKKQSVLKSTMQLIISLERSNFNFEKDEFWKNKTRIALPDQYSMSFPDKHLELLYIIVSIKLHIGNDMDNGIFVCDVLYYNTGT